MAAAVLGHRNAQPAKVRNYLLTLSPITLNEIKMKKLIICTMAAVMLLAGCGESQKSLMKRAQELAMHIPDAENLEQSRDWMTDGYYAVLDELFGMEDFVPVLDEWEFWFAAADGSPVAGDVFDVLSVEKADDTHATAVISVQPDDRDYEAEEHTLYMEKVDGRWLLSDYDGTRQSALDRLANYRKEAEVRSAISDYLVNEIGKNYLKGEICIPVIMFVAAEEGDGQSARFFGDFWVDWYDKDGDTLKSVSGGNHSGCMTLAEQGGKLVVTGFEQTVDGAGNDASARRIFGSHYDVFHNIHSRQEVREAARRDAISNYCRRNGIDVKYYQDYGWPAVEINPDQQ